MFVGVYFNRSNHFYIYSLKMFYSEDLLLTNGMVITRDTHLKKQGTQHDCLPNLLGDGDK
jgi:hypothetical protein